MEIGIQRHAGTTVFPCLSQYLGVRCPAESDVVNVNSIPSRAGQDSQRGARNSLIEKKLDQAAPTVRT